MLICLPLSKSPNIANFFPMKKTVCAAYLALFCWEQFQEWKRWSILGKYFGTMVQCGRAGYFHVVVLATNPPCSKRSPLFAIFLWLQVIINKHRYPVLIWILRLLYWIWLLYRKTYKMTRIWTILKYLKSVDLCVIYGKRCTQTGANLWIKH